MTSLQYLSEDELIRQGLEALMKALGPIEQRAFLPCPTPDVSNRFSDTDSGKPPWINRPSSIKYSGYPPKQVRTNRGLLLTPETMLVWPLYGAGLENFGQDGRSVGAGPCPARRRSDPRALRRRGALLLRCQDPAPGQQPPRLYHRDLAAHPIVQGHEVTMTVVEVGEAWRDRFAPGQRLALQADIYYRGLNLAVGYVF